MTLNHDTNPKEDKPHRLKLVVMFSLVLGAGALYMSQSGSDWLQRFVPAEDPKLASTSRQAAPSPSTVLPSFDAISADESGMLIAAGKANAGAAVALLNGTEKLGEAQADENGEWVMMLEKPLPAGDYSLSLRATDPKTHESAFSRKALAFAIAPHKKAGAQPQLAAAGPIGADRGTASAAKAKVTDVRKGDTLWNIARDHYGDGMRYPEIVDANKAVIKNPNLIYPNQQFEIPQK